MAFDPTKAQIKLLEEMRKLLAKILEKLAPGTSPTGGQSSGQSAGGTNQTGQQQAQPNLNIGEILSGGLNKILSTAAALMGSKHEQARQQVDDLEKKYGEQEADLLKKVEETKQAMEVFRQAQLDVATASQALERAETERKEKIRQAGGEPADFEDLNESIDDLTEALSEAKEKEKKAETAFEKAKSGTDVGPTEELNKAALAFQQAQEQASEAAKKLSETQASRAAHLENANPSELEELDKLIAREHENVRSTHEALKTLQGRGTYTKAAEEENKSRSKLNDLGKELEEARETHAKTKGFNFGEFTEGLGAAGGKLGDMFGGGHSQTLADALNQGDIPGMMQQGAKVAELIPRAMEGDPSAIFELVKEGFELVKQNMEAIVEHVKGMARAVDKGMTSDKLEDELGAAVDFGKEGAGAFVRAAGGPIAGPIVDMMMQMNPMIKFQEAIVGSIATLRRWNDAVHQANMKFAEFSASMSMVQARAEWRRILLEQERGERRSGSAEYFEQGRFMTEQRMAKWEDGFANAKHLVLGSLNRIGNLIADIIPGVGIAEKLLELWNEMFRRNKGDIFQTPFIELSRREQDKRLRHGNRGPEWRG